ncbi:MAG TPA: response regulator [Chthoniobacterales bacterium]|nr:response regulator [Chthoniobacterales bacterium]
MKPDRPKADGRKVICVVDDDPSVLKSVARLLESEGFSVRTFAHPDESLKYMEEHSVPLAILDIWMQEMTGMELLAHLCARSPQTHAIFITGHEDDAAQATVMQAGAFAFFIKPLDDAKFLAAVHRALGDPLSEKPGLMKRAQTFLKGDRRLSKHARSS